MKKIQTKDIWLLVAQVLILSLFVLSPGLISYVISHDKAQLMTSLSVSGYWLAPMGIVYLLNFYLLVPFLWFRRKIWLFLLLNVALVTICNSHILFNDTSTMPEIFRAGFSSFASIAMLINWMAIGIALSIRYVMRQQERKQKEVEAELAWLKNQINPHFLFNTLNNISSLAQIDGDETQEAIMQLSDLLRYAMYETNKPKVPISGEVEFMKNYIELMKLRCNEMTKVNCQLSIINYQLEIAPLLFISLIENAFKHGMNSNAPATIDIKLEVKETGDRSQETGDRSQETGDRSQETGDRSQETGDRRQETGDRRQETGDRRQESGASTQYIVFTCDNTNNPKPTKDRSGSGIGLDNTRRRLDLLYPGRYTWEQEITPENVYHVRISIKL